MTKSRPPYQLELALPRPSRGEAPRLDRQEVEAVTATAEPESPASTEHLMEAICAPDNIEAALRAVVRNKGAPGIDGITVKQLPGILKARWSEIEDQLLQGRYQPLPVRRVRIPKPAGGTRNLGIPTIRSTPGPCGSRVWQPDNANGCAIDAINLPLCAGDRRDRRPLGRIIHAGFCNSAAHLGATHVEHPAHHCWGALHGTRPRKDPGFPA